MALGATPKQVYIDGIPQLKNPHNVEKPKAFQVIPQVPNYDHEADDAVGYTITFDLITTHHSLKVKFEGLPPLEPQVARSPVVVFANVGSVFSRAENGLEQSFRSADSDLGVVVVENGTVVCAGTSASCPTASFIDRAQVIDLEGGSISPGLVTFGAPLGLEEISGEASTGDGAVLDPFYDKVPSITGGDKSLIRAVDGLQYGGRDVLCVLSSPVFRFPA